MSAPRPSVPRMNGCATGIANQAMTTRPIDTIAPAFVPGTGILPKAILCGSGRLCRPTFSNTSHLLPQLLLFDDAKIASGHIFGLRLAEDCEHGRSDVAQRTVGLQRDVIVV